MMTAKRLTSIYRQRGFSLLELMAVVAILGIVVAIAMAGTSQLIRTNSKVSNNVDLIQEGRQFMDQISRDIHQSGYPSYKMFDQSAAPSPNNYAGSYNAAAPNDSNPSGLVLATATELRFEGDVDNSGLVSLVVLKLDVPLGGCPCIMKRGTIQKSASPGDPPFYTELTGVMNTDVFSYWTYRGDQWDPAIDTRLDNIRTVKIRLQVQSQHKDAGNGMYSVATLETESKINN